ncbi:uncharacterized protein [Zea mays]|uniref:uncharacterized protein isoform X1 n=1 Tax=Zea mays TaxID=4577 RepID=UPI000C6C7F01|nr:uncharacterized protein LOC100281270 isoform X1 [Zea mays]|eukprot:XP_023156042.1 acetyltransferase, GNAT family protein isoform X1 [Zea mays]
MAATSIKVAHLTTLALFSPTPNPFGPKSSKHRARAPPPISISMDPALVDPAHLQALMLACGHSCTLRLSPALSVSAVEPVDLSKLRTALAHSFVVVSVFCGARFFTHDREREGEGQRFLGLEIGLDLQGERRLVGFGRAVSDLGLTASVHDIVVHPLLQRRGIGQKIVNKITRPFFEACGFGDDMMGSTTMLYTRKTQK